MTGISSKLDRLNIKHEVISRYLYLQQKMAAFVSVIRDAPKPHNSDSNVTHRTQTNLLKQQKIVSQIEVDVRKLNADMNKLNGTIPQPSSQVRPCDSTIVACLYNAKSYVNRLAGGFTYHAPLPKPQLLWQFSPLKQDCSAATKEP